MQTALQTFRPRDKDPELTSGKPPPAPVAQGITMRFEDVDLDQDSFGILDTPQFQKKP
jgi:hypothetical protein